VTFLETSVKDTFRRHWRSKGTAPAKKNRRKNIPYSRERIDYLSTIFLKRTDLHNKKEEVSIMTKHTVSTLNLEGVHIGFRNFAGKETAYNQAGSRNFVVFLEEDQADELAKDGWNVKYPKPEKAAEGKRPYLPVQIGFNAYPPKIYIISNGEHTQLDESSLSMLDWADISNCDLVIRPYNWEVNGKSGTKAYVKAMYVTLDTDEFADKYGIL